MTLTIRADTRVPLVLSAALIPVPTFAAQGLLGQVLGLSLRKNPSTLRHNDLRHEPLRAILSRAGKRIDYLGSAFNTIDGICGEGDGRRSELLGVLRRACRPRLGDGLDLYRHGLGPLRRVARLPPWVGFANADGAVVVRGSEAETISAEGHWPECGQVTESAPASASRDLLQFGQVVSTVRLQGFPEWYRADREDQAVLHASLPWTDSLRVQVDSGGTPP